MAWPTFLNIEMQDMNHCVTDLINLDRTWNLNRIASLFSTEMMSLITDIPLSQGAWADQRVLAHMKLPTVSLADMYPLVHSQSPYQHSSSFHWICQLQVPPRVKIFCWQLRWKQLPTKELLIRYSIILSHAYSCDVCPSVLEDCSHVLIFCALAKEAWSLLGHMFRVQISFLDLLAWFLFMDQAQMDPRYKAIVACLAWSLWIHRNDCVFNQIEVFAIQVVQKALRGGSFIHLSVPHAELLAAWLGVKTAMLDLHITKFILEGDLATVINWLKSQHRSSARHISFFQDLQM